MSSGSYYSMASPAIVNRSNIDSELSQATTTSSRRSSDDEIESNTLCSTPDSTLQNFEIAQPAGNVIAPANSSINTAKPINDLRLTIPTQSERYDRGYKM